MVYSNIFIETDEPTNECNEKTDKRLRDEVICKVEEVYISNDVNSDGVNEMDSIDTSKEIDYDVNEERNNESQEEGEDREESKDNLNGSGGNNEEESVEIEIPVETLYNIRYRDRKELGSLVKALSIKQGFRLRYAKGELEQKKTGAKVSTLNCTNTKCSFYLEFHTLDDGDKQYRLMKTWNKHNHILKISSRAEDLTSEISQRIQDLKNIAENPTKLTEAINKEFKTSFGVNVIRYQLKKIKKKFNFSV